VKCGKRRPHCPPDAAAGVAPGSAFSIVPAVVPAVALTGALVLSALLSACAPTSAPAPLGRAPAGANVAAPSQGLHRVKRGDSLYSIAWRYGLDYRDLSHWNAIPQPYTIYPRQLLRVSRPDVLPPMPAPRSTNARLRTSLPAPSNTKPVTSAPAAKSAAVKKAPSPRAQSKRSRPAAVTTTRSKRTVRDWRWPVKGKVIGSFGKAGGKGIDIAGRRGSAIKAAAPGHVVYSGSGLRGYGRLIIVKHNKRYLSAYAHNDRLHVKEGDTVQGGQRIAEMGDSGAKSVRLHFEIRRDGMPVDPTRFLPR